MVFHEGHGGRSDHGIDNQPHSKTQPIVEGEDTAKIEPQLGEVEPLQDALFSRSRRRGFSLRMISKQT